MSEDYNVEKYKGEYSEESFWEKVKRVALKAGREVIEKSLCLYHALLDVDTPVWAKGVILGALGYFISPIDVIPDFTPVIGYTDDLAVLAGAVLAVAAHIKDVHRQKAQETLVQWFG